MYNRGMKDHHTNILPAGQQALDVVQVNGQPAYYHHLSDAEINDALPRLTDKQRALVYWASQGLSKDEALARLELSPNTFHSWMYNRSSTVFRNCYYTICANNKSITTEVVRALARNDAFLYYEEQKAIALDSDAKSARDKAVKLNAIQHSLKLAGLDQPTREGDETIELIAWRIRHSRKEGRVSNEAPTQPYRCTEWS